MEEGLTPKDYLVVIPSIRPVVPDYLQALNGLDIFIADDSDGKVDRKYISERQYLSDGFSRVFLGDRNFTYKYVPGDLYDLFPNHCPSVKDIGLYFAYQEGYKAAILIDDDCDTSNLEQKDFLTIGNTVESSGYQTPSGWFNTLLLLGKPDIYARGYPYEYRGEGYYFFNNRFPVEPAFNQGLWVGTPDINGIDKLLMDKDYVRGFANPQIYTEIGNDEPTPWYIPLDTVVDHQMRIEPNGKLPLSIMNCQIAKGLIPAFYQPPDYLFGAFRIRRHDDIWSMYFMKKVAEIHNLQVTVGNPLVWHRKAGDPLSEIVSEHGTNLIQRRLTDIIDQASNSIAYTGDVPAITASLLAQECSHLLDVFGYKDLFNKILVNYFLRVRRWADIFIS